MLLPPELQRLGVQSDQAGDVRALVADRIAGLLADPAGAAAMGEKGMAWIDREWRWELVAQRLRQILAG